MTNDNTKLSKTGFLIKSRLAEHLGVSIEDIAHDDSLREDLHMSPSEISDFIALLKKFGVQIDAAEFANIETLNDLIEIATDSEEF